MMAEGRGLISAYFVGGEHIDKDKGLPFDFVDYLELTDWTGRAIRDDKTGAIPNNLAPILERLNIAPHAWLDNIRYYGHRYYRAVGTKDALKRYGKALGQKWLCGVKAAHQVYKPAPA